MAFTDRGRRQAYDNIASGSVAGRERTNTDTVSPFDVHGGGKNTSTSTNLSAVGTHTNVAAGVSVSEQGEGAVVGGIVPEQLNLTTNTEELLG